MPATDLPTARYPCEDYLASPYAAAGLWDEPARLWLIEPLARTEEHATIGFLQVGRPGVDGVGLGYRAGQAGFWAYHPIDGRFERLAPSLESFLAGWHAGRISV